MFWMDLWIQIVKYFYTMFYMQGTTILMLVVFSVLGLVYSSVLRKRRAEGIRRLREYSVKLVIPLLVFLVPYNLLVQFTSYSFEIAFFGAGWFSRIASSYWQFTSIIGIDTGGITLLPLIFPLVLGIQLPFIISLNRYFKKVSSKKQTQILGFIIYIIAPLILNRFSAPYLSSTYFRITLFLPFPIVYIVGLLLMKFFPRGELDAIEVE